eukprot:COSAG02_NODE_5182_length_4563_cov_4.094982_7_plen_221_part_00
MAGILDKRRGDSPELAPDSWNLLCAKLKLKYGQHPLQVMVEHMDRMLELDSDSDGGDDLDFDDSEFGEGESDYQDSLMDAMDELGWDTETEGGTATDAGGDESGSDDFDTPRSDTGGALADSGTDAQAETDEGAEDGEQKPGQANGYGTVAVDLAAEAEKAKETMKALRKAQMDKPPPVAMKKNPITGKMEKFESEALKDDLPEEEAESGEIEIPVGDDY